jgi:hypothetical protein
MEEYADSLDDPPQELLDHIEALDQTVNAE